MTCKFEGLTMNQLAERNAELHMSIAALTVENTELQRKVEALAVENAAIKTGIQHAFNEMESHHDTEGLFSYDADGEQMDALLRVCDAQGEISKLDEIKTPATDAALADIRNEARAEGIYFTANRLLGAWDAGFIDSPSKEVIDVARMILSAAEMLKDATEGDFSRKFADEIMEEMKPQLRKESGK